MTERNKGENTMKKTVCALIALILITSLCACGDTYTELGIPLSERYPEGMRARCPWDMIVWEGKLYVGGGDYDANSGPVDIWYYDIDNGIWNNSGTVPDEEINRFTVINGSLTAPGIDPKEDWDLGNYYKLSNGEWKKHRVIPGGVHCFDMIEYGGMIFCGLGVVEGEYPIARSTDGGESFEQIKMYRGGAPIDTHGSQFIRVYDLFVFGEDLYAAYTYGDTEVTYELYRYENGVFVYDNTWSQKIHRIKYSYKNINEKIEFGGNLFFATGYLYSTSDMENFTRITFPERQTVYDIAKNGDSIYALCARALEDGTYLISVWKNKSGKPTDFIKVFHFTYEIPPVSFAVNGNSFYIGMGDFNNINDKNGMVLCITK